VSFALTEMRRRPQRFVTAAVILTLMSVLLMFLGGLLDGLVAGSTDGLAAQPGQLLVFSADAQGTLTRSRIAGDQRPRIAEVDGVDSIGGLSVIQLGARRGDPASRDLVDVAVFAYELAPRGVPAPPADGQVWADASIEADGVSAGTTLLVGPARTPLTVAGLVADTTYAGQASLWASPATWRAVAAANRPDIAVSEDVSQALVIGAADPALDTEGLAALARSIDGANAGATETFTIAGAIDAVPGIAQQRSVFSQIIGVTLLVAAVVVALFFALIVVERTSLYGVLKAMGARRGALVGGVVAQAVVVSLVAAAAGTGLAAGLAAALPPGSIPFTLSAARVIASIVLILAASVLGCLTSLRRVLRIHPASAIGSAS
jgi:putative ABC transport system permease protein